MKQIAGLFLLLVAMMLVAAWLAQEGNSGKLFDNYLAQTPAPTPEPTKTMNIGSYTFTVEVVDGQEERQRGLSGRKALEKDTGMLFVFDKQNTRPSFWMKGMEIPIDIVWIDNDKVVQLNTDVAPDPKDTPDEKLRLYTPNQPIDYVVELSAGTIKAQKIRVGDRAELPQ